MKKVKIFLFQSPKTGKFESNKGERMNKVQIIGVSIP